MFTLGGLIGGKGGLKLEDLFGMGASPMGWMMARHPQAGLGMMSPFGFALSRLFK